MPDVLFYHLERQPLEAVLPTLLQKTRERGWRAVVQATTDERMTALDDHLWTFTDDSFLAHGTDREPHGEEQPILLTLSAANPNDAAIRFLVESAGLPADMDFTSGSSSCSTAKTTGLLRLRASNGAP